MTPLVVCDGSVSVTLWNGRKQWCGLGTQAQFDLVPQRAHETPHARARAEVMAAAHALAHGRGLGTLSSNVDRLRRAVSDLEKSECTTDEMPGATGGSSVVWQDIVDLVADRIKAAPAYMSGGTRGEFINGMNYAIACVLRMPAPPPWATVATPATGGESSNHPDTTHETPGAAGVAGGALQTPEPVWTAEKEALQHAMFAEILLLMPERRHVAISRIFDRAYPERSAAFPPATQRAENGDG